LTKTISLNFKRKLLVSPIKLQQYCIKLPILLLHHYLKFFMKKLLILLFVVACVSMGKAQELGLRFGDAIGGNVAVDGVFSSGKFSRIHADISFGDGLGLEALWDVIYRPLGADGFDWYLGVGPYLFIGDPFELGVSGELGIEYHFKDIPLALGVDWRPTLRLIDDTDMLWGKAGFNIRYVFGKSKNSK
jgi:hypothetical protein